MLLPSTEQQISSLRLTSMQIPASNNPDTEEITCSIREFSAVQQIGAIALLDKLGLERGDSFTDQAAFADGLGFTDVLVAPERESGSNPWIIATNDMPLTSIVSFDHLPNNSIAATYDIGTHGLQIAAFELLGQTEKERQVETGRFLSQLEPRVPTIITLADNATILRASLEGGASKNTPAQFLRQIGQLARTRKANQNGTEKLLTESAFARTGNVFHRNCYGVTEDNNITTITL